MPVLTYADWLANAPMPPRETLPTMFDLPYEEIGEPASPDEFHALQAMLLSETFQPTTVAPDQFMTAMDLYLYYDWKNTLWYKRPDWFAVVGVPRLHPQSGFRYSYVTWEEGVPPLIVVELLSDGTEKEDLGLTVRDADGPPVKWDVYERILGIPYYAVFSRDTDELRFFVLKNGKYIEVKDHDGRLWIPEAGLFLGLWRGDYKWHDREWLRWCDADGNWIPTGEERAEQEYQRAEQTTRLARQERANAGQALRFAELERQRAEQERQRAERLAEMLRQLGQDPDRI